MAVAKGDDDIDTVRANGVRIDKGCRKDVVQAGGRTGQASAFSFFGRFVVFADLIFYVFCIIDGLSRC